MGKNFWQQDTGMWDQVNNVGLRNHYICSVYAARMMIPRKEGLIVNVSSGDGLWYLFNVAYGIGKEACDRMAADCGFELRKESVAFVSLWPGAVRTETVLKLTDNTKTETATPDNASVGNRYPDRMREMFQKGENPEFAGQCIAGLAVDPDLMEITGKIVMTYDLGRKYRLHDAPRHSPMDMCQVKMGMIQSGHTWMAACMPGFVRLPKWLLSLGGNKSY